MSNHELSQASIEAREYARRVVAAEVRKLAGNNAALLNDKDTWAKAQANVKTLCARVLAVLSIPGYQAYKEK